MPRGPLESRIQAISAAYHYTQEPEIKEFCNGLRQTVDPDQKRMNWHRKTNELHAQALKALEEVAEELKNIRKEVCTEVQKTCSDPKVIKTESLKQMNEYLVCLKHECLQQHLYT